jgi:hypothetical protein
VITLFGTLEAQELHHLQVKEITEAQEQLLQTVESGMVAVEVVEVKQVEQETIILETAETV